MAFEYSRIPAFTIFGMYRQTTAQTTQIDSSWVFETSGDCWFTQFISPVTQTNAALTLYAYCTAVTGSPNAMKLQVRNWSVSTSEPDRPEAGGAVLASSGDVDCSTAAGTWVTFSISSVSLTIGKTYGLILYNNHATDPVNNHATFQYRSLPLNLTSSDNASIMGLAQSGYTTNGFSADPSGLSTTGMCGVIKFSDGSLLGNPYVAVEGHASNANDRGNRYNFTEDVIVSGFCSDLQSSALQYFEINQASSNVLQQSIADAWIQIRAGGGRCTPTTLNKSTDYDCVLTYSGSSSSGTIFTMGAQAEGSVPTNVKACRVCSYIDGSGPPYTAITNKMMSFGLVIDSNPAQAVNGGLSVLGNSVVV